MFKSTALILALLTSAVFAWADDGLETKLTADQVNEIEAWTHNTKAALQLALEESKSLNPGESKQRLYARLNAFIQDGAKLPRETFLRYTLNRAIKISDLLNTDHPSTAITDLQLRMVWISSERALELSNEDISISGEFGVDSSSFLMAWNESVLNASLQYKIGMMTLGFFENDLERDPAHTTLAPGILKLHEFIELEEHKAPKKDVDYAAHYVRLRAVYSEALTFLKGTPRFAQTIEDPENPSLDYHRKVLRKEMDDPDLTIQLSALQRFEKIDIHPRDQLVIATKLNSLKYTLCSEAFQILNQSDQLAGEISPLLLEAAQSQKIRECRNDAIVLLGRIPTQESVNALTKLMDPCIPGDMHYLAQIALSSVLSSKTDFLKGYRSVCTKDSFCIGDPVLSKQNGQFFIASVASIVGDNQVALIPASSGSAAVKTRDLSPPVDCIGGVCVEDHGMLKEHASHKITSALKRLSVGMIPFADFTPAGQWGTTEIERYHTFLDISAAFANGTILLSDGSWGEAKDFESLNGTGRDCRGQFVNFR